MRSEHPPMVSDPPVHDRFFVSSSCRLPLRLAPNIYLLGSHYFNTYLVRGKICALVEGGFSIQLPALLKQLRSLHVSLRDIRYMVVLHAHPDHVMTFPRLKELYPWMQIVGHTESRTVLQNEAIISKFRELDREVSRAMVRDGLSEGNAIQGSNLTLSLDGTIEEGESIDLGNGMSLKAMHTPGHSPDSVSLYWPEHRIIFVSDALGIFYAPDYVKPGFFYDLALYEDSLKRIGDVGAGILCKGHQGAIVGAGAVQDYITLAFKGIRSFKTYVEKAVRAGWSEDSIAAFFTHTNQIGVTSLFPWDSNYRLSRLLIRRLLERSNRVPATDRHKPADMKRPRHEFEDDLS